ncbi:MAG: hypothetical protein C0424_10280 [Sphingobacteriaceae bacterium]|nr:hypothetical protein [Sphingobacteriaceae bacterium]
MKIQLLVFIFSIGLCSCQYAAKEKKLSQSEIDSIHQAPFKALEIKPIDTLRLSDPQYVGKDELSIAVALLRSYNRYSSLDNNELEYLIERHDQFLTYKIPFNASEELRMLKIDLDHQLRLISFWLPQKIREKTFADISAEYSAKGITVTAHGETIEFYGRRYDDSTKAIYDYKKVLPKLIRGKYKTAIYASKKRRKTFNQ